MKEQINVKRYDLHTHTQASDGMQPPADNVRWAKEKGLAGVAITDHDTVAGLEEALKEGKRIGINVVPGVEISTRAGGKDIHILGYFMDYRNKVFLERLEKLRQARDTRNDLILSQLRSLGVEITLDEVVATMGRPLAPDESIGRPHMADTLVQKGYAKDMRDAFDRYLAEGAPGYVSVPRVEPAEAINWIREAGGVPVVAHPGLYGNDELVRSIIEEAKPAGLEVRHSDHDAEAESRYTTMAAQYGLIATGGSDFHGARQGVIFHGDLGSRSVEGQVVEELRKAAVGQK
ncbi:MULTISPECIES: PHP domain-containing protein [Paenibacillus]|uniref:PHP domain-containing protein n=1 Tax=Paenibacillus peoriae TaxID=59893 RepID=A0A7H0Y445_9BACL|nr:MULTISPECIES: PHP domain-containing protein [Paenibacillus]KOS02977.1 metal-dependent phosphoesterase [Paenibacillus polymyxa]QNR65853.1 PHP domain-containing protein [Paenibacillus peoriae]